MKRLYPNQPLVGVGAVIVSSGKILLAKRKNEPGRGKWAIPGGLVELGEETWQTVIRETWEETGLIVEKPVLIGVIDNVEFDENRKVKFHFVIIDYFVKIKGGSLAASSDVADLRWVSFDEVKDYELTKTFRKFFIEKNGQLRGLESS